MEIQKFIFLLCCTSIFASEYVIPVENYETELQNLGQHVEYPETPIKVIKITKTVAVKVPVPYPVKVVEKVPYPVHVAKPYPVPVPQIVHVPQPAHPPAKSHEHQPLDASNEEFLYGHRGNAEGQYQVQEKPSQSHESPLQDSQSYYGGINHNGHFEFGNDGHSPYESPNYNSDNHDNGSYESKRREQILNFGKTKST